MEMVGGGGGVFASVKLRWRTSAVNLRYVIGAGNYVRTGGILFGNRIKGQRDQISETILETEMQHTA
jgi:hypothetical protein